MKKALLVLVLVGLASLTIGISAAFANFLQGTTIRCTGRIASPSEQLESTESNSQMYVDARVQVPIVAGLGLLSIAFLYEKFIEGSSNRSHDNDK